MYVCLIWAKVSSAQFQEKLDSNINFGLFFRTEFFFNFISCEIQVLPANSCGTTNPKCFQLSIAFELERHSIPATVHFWIRNIIWVVKR